MAGFPLAPWHMWGSAVNVSAINAAGQQTVSQQIAKINYKRPETWSFFFGAKLTGGDQSSVDIVARCVVNLIIGVGRSAFNTQERATLSSPAFAVFDWIVPVGNVPSQQNSNVKYTTSIQTLAMQDTQAATTTRLVDHLVAQDIQCFALFGIQAGDPNISVQAEITGFFAPRTHIRPEWFSEGEQFRGMEVGGS